jgi:hypothetical protein
MKEARRHPKEAPSTGKVRSTTSRTLPWVIAGSIVLILALVGLLRLRPDSTANTKDAKDAYAGVPFRPRVTYDSLNVSVSNTEGEPYFDTSLNLYVGATLYSLRVGTIRPGETITRSLRSLTDERGESFEPGVPKTSELEVRARFGGYNVHKDFPPPP